MRLTILPLMLMSPPPPPNAGSGCCAAQPTEIPQSVHSLGEGAGWGGTSRQEAVFGEDCDGVYDQHHHCSRPLVSPFNVGGATIKGGRTLDQGHQAKEHLGGGCGWICVDLRV